MSSRYATNTSVPVSKTKAEIEDLLHKYGCTGFLSGWAGNSAHIGFQIGNRQVRFVLPMPDKKSNEFWKTPGRGSMRTADQAHASWEQACRQRWRALLLSIKGKLEAIEIGIATFDQEFLAHIITFSGKTVGEEIIPLIEANQTPRLSLTTKG